MKNSSYESYEEHPITLKRKLSSFSHSKRSIPKSHPYQGTFLLPLFWEEMNLVDPPLIETKPAIATHVNAKNTKASGIYKIKHKQNNSYSFQKRQF